MKRIKSYSPQKRTTFLRLFLKALCAALICTVIFANAFRSVMDNKIRQEILDSVNQSEGAIVGRAARNEAKGSPVNDIHGYMSMYTNFWVMFEDIPKFLMRNDNYYPVNSDYGNTENYAMSAILDKEGNIIASSRAKLTANLIFGKDDKDNGIYVCDVQQTDIPEVQELYGVYYDLLGGPNPDPNRSVSFSVNSAYVDKDAHIFIPHEADLELYTYKKNNQPLVEAEVTETRHISITLDDDDYELVDCHRLTDKEYPKIALCSVHGTPWESFDNNIEKVGEYGVARSGGNFRSFECLEHKSVYVNGEQCTLNLFFHSNTKGTIAETYYRLGVAAFGLISALLALLWAWQKNVRNKARYAFEDYQRDLTDHLAHDIKTPLMAISGYAENVLNGKLTEEEQKEYLNSILDNVSFTDSLISKTLYLNHMEGKSTSGQEEIKVNDMAEEILGRYALLLHEKKIVYSVSGDAEVRTDRASMETILENLISNAVKYTPEDGTLRIAIDKKQLTVTNTVSEKTDTRDLKRPFVRGDAARSNTDGNGLGLAIAERAALANGFRLSVSCTDTEFRTELRF